MNDGFHADDIFRMVEDEFVATAKLYSQHIHYAEYVRLKKLAASRGKDTLAKLRRGTDGKTEKSMTLKLREEAEENVERRALDQNESDDEYLMDPQLAGLMTGGRRFREDMSQDLSARIPAPKSHTRAAAGFSQSPHKEHKTFDAFAPRPGKGLSRSMTQSSLIISDDDETDEDDLGAAPPPLKNRSEPSTKKVLPAASTLTFDFSAPQSRSSGHSCLDTSSRVTNSDLSRPRASVTQSPSTSIRASDYATKTPSEPSSFKASAGSIAVDEETKKARATEYIAQKRAARERREREEKRKAAKAVTIPTFI
jgi:hypothetical protein